MKDTWKDYFAFNKRQRNGLLILLTLIVLLVTFLFISDYFPSLKKPADFSSFKGDIEKAGLKTTSANPGGISSASLIDINTADTNVLMTLPKMTSYCAEMIVKYRKKLGGYYSTKQLKEVWGMDSAMLIEVLPKVRADTTSLSKLNINTADIRQLGYHPYIRYYLAKAIVNYRDIHGPFTSVKALRNMAAIDDSIYAKISPYLMVGNK